MASFSTSDAGYRRKISLLRINAECESVEMNSIASLGWRSFPRGRKIDFSSMKRKQSVSAVADERYGVQQSLQPRPEAARHPKVSWCAQWFDVGKMTAITLNYHLNDKYCCSFV